LNDNVIASTPVERASVPCGTEYDMNNKNIIVDLLDHHVDFQSIQSLRGVNKLFYNTFEEFGGWC